MATAAPNHHSPRSTSAAEIGVTSLNSPKSRRSSSARGVSSPWTQIVRGGESESVAVAASGVIIQSPQAQEQIESSSDWSHSQAASAAARNSSSPALEDAAAEAQGESSENESGSNAAKKPVWNKPNGAKEVGAVMGAVSWPALSESTKASPKPVSSDLPKTISDGLIPVSQGTVAALSSPSSPHKQLHSSNNAHATSTPNHAPNRQRSFKRGGGNSSNNAPANGSFSQQQQPHGPVADMTTHNFEKSGNSGAELSSRDNVHRDGQRGGYGSQSHGGNEHQHHRSSNRRGNGGPRPRGDSSYNHGYGGARDQDRGGQEWSPNRSFNGRDAHMQPPQRFPSRPFIRGPPTPPPFIPPTVPIRPFNPPIIYPEVASSVFYVTGPPPESFRMPMIGPMAPMFYHVQEPEPDPQLHDKIVKQIDYYFSNENLIKDMYLRGNMDEQGWVPITLIAGFKKVSMLTSNIQIILDALQTSSVVEVQGEKLRRRDDWMKWIVPPPMRSSSKSSPQAVQNSSSDMVMAHLQSVTLDEMASNHGNTEAYISRTLSGEQPSGNEMTGPITAQGGHGGNSSN